MSKLFAKFRVLVCATVGSLFLGLSGASYATAFQVAFDPYTELFGTAIFNLRAPCLAHDNDYDTFAELVGLGLAGCYITLEGAHISTDGAGGPYVDYTAEFPLVLVSELVIANHQLAGLTTLFPIRLEVAGEVEEAATFALSSSFFHDECDATLSFTASGSVSFTGCENGRPLAALPGTVTAITQIPEPGTLALLVGAGFAGWWSRRRRPAA